MNYKNILLVGLLLPAFCLGSTLEQLKEEQYQKELEVRDLTKKIAEAYRYVQEARQIYSQSLDDSVDERLEKMDNPIDREEMRKIILKEDEMLYNDVAASVLGKQLLNRSLFDDLFDNDEPESFLSFHADKFLEISGFLEYAFIRNTVRRYEQRIKELVDINRRIYELEQEGDHA